MGATYIRGFLDEGINEDVALQIHLQNNHYPPIDLRFLPAVKRALKFARKGNWDHRIKLGNGKMLMVSQVVEQLRLDTFLENDEEYQEMEE